MPIAPENCESMDEVRDGVDATDRELIALLARRFGYMIAAARIKPDRGDVRDEPRKAAVIAAAVREAKAHRLPEALIEQMWDVLVEGSIAYEYARWDEQTTGR